MSRHHLVVATAALSFLLACTRESKSAAIVVRDSAGIEIIEHPADAFEAAAIWNTAPAIITMSKMESEEATLTRVTGAKRLSDGRFVVVDFDNTASQPMLFAADGSFERRLGGPGSGPGEFRFASIQAILPGDTIVFYDSDALRLTRMLPSGTVVNTQTLGSAGIMAVGAPTGRLGDGRMVSVPFPMEDTASGRGRLFRQRLPVIRIDPTQQTIDTLTFGVPGPEMYMASMSFGEESGSFPSPVPYGRTSRLIPAGDRILVADDESPDVVSYGLPWHPVRISRFARPRRAVTTADQEGYVAARRAEVERLANRPTQVKELFIKLAKESQYPDSMGYYASASLAADSALWLAEMRPMQDSIPTYVVIGSDGRLRARVTLPANSRLMWADADQVLLVLRDEDDVERVELRPLLKTAAP